MPRSHIVLLTLFIAIALSQAPVGGQQTPAAVTGAATVAAPLGADEVVARMMSFDRNRDGTIESSELPDRMQNLFDRGDTGRDGTLDGVEIRRLATAPTVSMTLAGGRQPGGYTFGDQIGFSTRMHIDGALNDLMLESPAREKAQTIVRKFEDDLESTATAELLKNMEPLLSADQLTAFRTMVERQSSSRIVVAPQLKDNARIFFFGMDLGRRVEMFGLPAAQRREATVAIERFNGRLRPDEDGRSALLKQLGGVLSDEERDNFRAALERRPLVKANTMPGVVSGVVNMTRPAEGFRAVERKLLLDSTVDAPVVVR